MFQALKNIKWGSKVWQDIERSSLERISFPVKNITHAAKNVPKRYGEMNIRWKQIILYWMRLILNRRLTNATVTDEWICQYIFRHLRIKIFPYTGILHSYWQMCSRVHTVNRVWHFDWTRSSLNSKLRLAHMKQLSVMELAELCSIRYC